MNLRGIDISHYNAGLNITALPADIAFVSIKMTEGATIKDELFQQNYHTLRDERPEIVRIPYHFFNFQQDGVSQAKNVLGCSVDYTKAGTGPLMLDLEGDGSHGVWVSQNKALAIQRVNDFIAYYRANGGRREIIIYSFDFFIKDNLGGHTWPDTIFWVSSFQPSPPPYLPGWPYKFWQYSDTGQVNGTTTGGSLDLDQFMGTQQELDALANR